MIDLEQARRRAKELRTSSGVRLVEAQHHIANGLGFATWTALVRSAEMLTPAQPANFPWTRMRRVSVVCFRDDGQLVLYADQGGWAMPTDRRIPGEDIWDDAVLRIPLQQMGFRRQGTHLLAVDHDRRRCVFWVDGSRYTGVRPHRTDAEWWTGPAADGAALLDAQGDQAVARLVRLADEARQQLPYDQYVDDLRRTLLGSYLRAETAEGGSGFGGSPQEWREARGVLADALDRSLCPSTFLDLACANGHLGASMVGWGADRGLAVVPYGVDIAPELVARAAALHPEWEDNFLTGDALTWAHPDGLRFDLVHMLLDVIPADRHADLINHLLDRVVAPGGRLLLSNYGNVQPDQSAEAIATRLGFSVTGRTRRPHRRGRPADQPSAWIQR